MGVLGGLRGFIGLPCVFVYCMSWKTQPPKLLGFRGDNGNLAPFIRDFSGRPSLPDLRGRCFQILPVETLGRRVVPPWFWSSRLLLSLLLHSLMCQYTGLGGTSQGSEPAPAARCRRQPRLHLLFPLHLMPVPTECTWGKPGL